MEVHTLYSQILTRQNVQLTSAVNDFEWELVPAIFRFFLVSIVYFALGVVLLILFDIFGFFFCSSTVLLIRLLLFLLVLLSFLLSVKLVFFLLLLFGLGLTFLF